MSDVIEVDMFDRRVIKFNHMFDLFLCPRLMIDIWSGGLQNKFVTKIHRIWNDFLRIILQLVN